MKKIKYDASKSPRENIDEYAKIFNIEKREIAKQIGMQPYSMHTSLKNLFLTTSGKETETTKRHKASIQLLFSTRIDTYSFDTFDNFKDFGCEDCRWWTGRACLKYSFSKTDINKNPTIDGQYQIKKGYPCPYSPKHFGN